MAKREIGTKIKLDGEAQFKASVSAINQNLAVLSSEMGAATSAFDKNNMSMSDLQKKSEIYGRQIDAQKQKLEVYTKALAEAEKLKIQNAEAAETAAKKYGEESEEAQKARAALEKSVKIYNDYQIKVNNTVKSINQLEKAQKDTDKAAEELKNSTKSLADKLKSVATVAGKAAAEITKIGAKTITKGIEAGVKAVTAYATALTSAATAVSGLAFNAAENAKQITAMSERVGFSTKAYQEWDYIARQAGSNMETLQGGITALAEKMDDASAGTGEAYEIFQKLGLSVKDSNGQLKNQQQMFEETIIALQGMENASERQALASKLMSTTGEELLPLLNGQIGSIDELKKQAEDLGTVMSEKTVSGLTTFRNNLDNIRSAITGAANSFLGSLAPSLNKTTNAIKDAIPKITALSTGLIDGSISAKDFSKKLLNGFKPLKNDITTGAEKLTTTFNNVFLAIINLAAETLPTTVTTLLPQLFAGFDNLISDLISLLPTLLPAVTEGAFMLFAGILTSFNKISDQLMPMLPDLINQTVDVLINNLPTLIESAFVLFTGLVTGLGNATPTLIKKVIELIPVIVKSLLEQIPLLVQCGADLIIALAKGLPESIPFVIEAIPQIITAIIDTITTTDWFMIGKNIVTAIMEGMTNSRTLIFEYALKFVNSVKESIAELLNNSTASNFFVGGVANLAVQPEKNKGSSQGGRRDIGNVYLTVNSNQPLSPTEIARQTRNSLALAGLR